MGLCAGLCGGRQGQHTQALSGGRWPYSTQAHTQLTAKALNLNSKGL